MLSSKSKSGLFEASATKAAPATPRTSKLGKAGTFKGDPDLHSPTQASRVSIDRSPKSDPKPAVERRSPRISTPPDKQPRVLKGSQAQLHLGAVQEDVKKVKDRLASVEKETNRFIEKLKEAKKSAEEANNKLLEALAAQKRAEEASEIDKFRADELEQASIEAAQRREKEWQKELEDVRNLHALDVATLGAMTQELQRVKQELLMTAEAKNSALSHADDAVKIAEINADKVEILSKEVNKLKTSLESALENKSSEDSEQFKNDLDLQTQLTSVQNELKKANVLLTSSEQEKSQILDELKDAKRLYDEANQRLQENLASREKANESVELEKLRSKELEKESIKAAQEREVEWQEKLESIRNQHAVDVAAFTSICEELERVKHELLLTTDAKNAALSHANDSLKIAQVNADKVNLLLGEINHLKSLLDSKLELEAEVLTLKDEVRKEKETEKRLAEMEALVMELRTEVINAKKAESDAHQLLDECKKKAQLLEVELEEENQSRKSSLDSLASVRKQLEECNHVMQEKEIEITVLKTKVDMLELDIARFKTDIDESARCLNATKEEAIDLNIMVENLKSELRIMEEAKMHALSNEKEAASRIENLMDEKNKLVGELEITQSDAAKVKQEMEEMIVNLKSELWIAEDAKMHSLSNEKEAASRIENLMYEKSKLVDELEITQSDAGKVKQAMEEMIVNLKSELWIAEDAKMHAMSNEKEAASRIENLMDEKSKLVDELEITQSDAGKVKQAMEELSCALNEASSKAREAQEKFLLKQVEAENARSQIADLKLTFKKIEGNQDVALEAVKHDIVQLQETTERLEREVDRSMTEWESKEINFVDSITKLEEDITRSKYEIDEIAESHKEAELKLQAANENEVQLQNKLKNLESEANTARQVAEDAKMESRRLKEMLLDKENELQSISQENDDLLVREAAAFKKAEEVSSLLHEAKMKQKKNAEVSPFDNSEENEHEQVEADKTKYEKEASLRKIEVHSRENQITKDENGKENNNNNNNNNNKAELLNLEDDILGNGKDKDLSDLKVQESDSTDDELDTKMSIVSFDQANELVSETTGNGATSPMKEHQQQQKKKNAFIQKFGNLLKKKSSTKEGSL